jgi:PAS domain S-box-containing protein
MPNLNPRTTVVLAALVVAAWLTALIALDLNREKALAIEAAEKRTQFQARSLEEHARQSLQRVELNLTSIAAAVVPPGGLAARMRTALSERLRQELAAGGPILSLVLIDADAAVLAASSDDAAARARVITQRESFGALRGAASPSPWIGAPIPAAAPGAQAMLPLALRLGAPGGMYQGALLAFIDLGAFQRVYDLLDTDQSGFATLFLRDGWIVVRAPADPGIQARNWSASPMFQERVPKAAVGTVRQTIAADNVERIYTYRVLPDVPLVVSFGVSLTEVLAAWRERCQRDGAILLAALMALVGASWAALRQIAQREAAQRSLRQSEARFRSLAELSSDWHWRIDAQLRIVEIGAAVAKASCIDSTPYIGKLAWELPALSPGLAEWARFQATLEARQVFHDFEIRRADVGAAMRWISTSGMPVFGPLGQFEGYLGVGRDISERKQTELALETQRLRIEGIIDSAMDGIVTIDADERIVVFNHAAERMFRCAAADMYGQSMGRLLMPAARDAHHGHIRSFGESGKSRRAPGDFAQVTALRADGEEFPTEISISKIEVGGKTLYTAILRDVSVQRRSQERLMLLQTCMERLHDMVLITEAEPVTEPGPRIVFVNQAFERRTGYLRNEVLGRSPCLLQGPLTQRSELERMAVAMQLRQPMRCELINYRKTGEAFWIEFDSVPIVDASGRHTHWVSVARDISERKQAEADRQGLEAQLRESQKMESIGTLAGGIAHDFNNILGAILGNVALANEDLGANPSVRTSLSEIGKAARRARSLVQQILAFSRRQPQELVLQPMRPLVEDTLGLLRSTLPAMVTLGATLSDEPVHVKADTTQVQQVLMNLCMNAWHALPNGVGDIRVGLDALVLAPGAAAPHDTMPPGRYAHLWVSDTGSGMDRATRERIFEPFFTTKAVGEGTGLGLAVVHGIVSAHHGAISVESEPGVGTTFHLYFPTSEAAAFVPAFDSTAPALLRGQGRHVLYVDDDEVMVLMVERLLVRAGFHVTCCADARAAITCVRATPELVDVVVTDFNMPEFSGLDLAEALAKMRPGLPVVISSGYISDDMRERARVAGVHSLLNKQDTLEALVPRIHDALADLALPP